MPSGEKTYARRKAMTLGEITKKTKLYRRDVQDILQCGTQTVFDHEAAGRIRRLGEDAGGVFFDPMSVCELVIAKNQASVFVRAVELFVSRATVLEISAQLNVSPDKVRELYRDYVTPIAATVPREASKAEEREEKEREQKAEKHAERRRKRREAMISELGRGDK